MCTAALVWGRVSRVLNSQRLTAWFHNPADRRRPASPHHRLRPSKHMPPRPRPGFQPGASVSLLRGLVSSICPPHCQSQGLNHPGRLLSPGCQPQTAGPVGPGKQDSARQPADFTPLFFPCKQTRQHLSPRTTGLAPRSSGDIGLGMQSTLRTAHGRGHLSLKDTWDEAQTRQDPSGER